MKFWFESEKVLDKVTLSIGLHLFAKHVVSGKTSVMFDLAERTFAGEQILTVEDSLEMVNAQFLQLQVNETIDNDYEELIKLSLRHRLDLLIVGEIRDRKTARALLQESLTGFTVFSTVHAKSVSGVHSRLLELGLSAWEIDNVLQTVVYQRLTKEKDCLKLPKIIFRLWKMENEMRRLMRMLQTDTSQLIKLKKKKLSPDKQSKLIQLMGNLLSNGFHLGEVVDFLERYYLVEKTFVQNMKMGLKSGQNLSSILERLNFYHFVLTQISLAEQHGNLTETLQLIEVNMRKKLQIQRKLIGILMYPILLIILLIGIILGLKNYLLPQISEGNGQLAHSNHQSVAQHISPQFALYSYFKWLN